MKKKGLSFVLTSATLFLVAARANDPQVAPAPVTSPSVAATATGTPVPAPGPAMDSAPAELLQRYDTNHDGKLDENELAVAHEKMMKQNQRGGADTERGKKFRAAMIKRFDRNGDGQLDEAEKAVMKKYFLDRFDTNHDGRLDEDERDAMREQLRADAKAGKFKN